MNLLARLRQRAPGVAAPPAPSAPLPTSAVQHALRLSTVEGALSTVHLNVTIGAFLAGFALLLGAGPFELGLLGALPFLSQLAQFAGAYLEERLGQRRALTAWTAAVSRLLWLPIAALPFVSFLGLNDILVFLVILALSQALIGIAANAWTSWMSDLVPPRQRGRYFGFRNTVCAVSAMLSTWAAGALLDSFRTAGNEAAGYAVIFVTAVVLALLGVLVLTQQPEPPMRRRERLSIRELFAAPLRHTGFRALNLAAAGWAIVTGIAAPFFNAYGIQTLGLSFTTLALFGVATSAVSIICQPYVGRLQDRLGDRTVLIWSVIGVTLLPWGWVFSRSDFLLPLWLTSIFAGVFWPGINQGLLNIVMERAPAEGRGAFVASFGAFTGIGNLISGVLGGALAALLGSALVQLGPIMLTQYSILFALSSLGRGLMALVFARRL